MLTPYSQMSLYLACIYYERVEKQLVTAIRRDDDWLSLDRERADLAEEIEGIRRHEK